MFNESDLIELYNIYFMMKHDFNIEFSEIDKLLPFELDIYMTLLLARLKEDNERRRKANL